MERQDRIKEAYQFLEVYKMISFEDFKSASKIHPFISALCPSISVHALDKRHVTLWVGDNEYNFSSHEDAYQAYKVAYEGVVASIKRMLSGLEHEFNYS